MPAYLARSDQSYMMYRLWFLHTCEERFQQGPSCWLSASTQQIANPGPRLW